MVLVFARLAGFLAGMCNLKVSSRGRSRRIALALRNGLLCVVFWGPLPRLDYENELLFGLLAGVSCQLIVAGPENRLTVSCWNGMGWEGRSQSQSQSSLGLEWRFRQTLSFSLNKRQLTSFSFLAFMHCVRLMCVSVCQAKPSHPIHLGIGIVHFPKTNNPHSYNNNNNIAFLLMMTHALSYAQSQLWLRFFFLRASLSLFLSWLCVGKV